MEKKIVIAGGTGFIGNYLANYYKAQGYTVHIIARHAPSITWKDESAIVNALENAELLINLAGKSVDCRYNDANKAEILSSRIDTTTALGKAILQCQNPPPLWMNSSTATIYRHAEDRPMTENEGEIGSGFSVNVATQWEKTFFDFKLPHTRQVALRIAIVLGNEGGAFVPLKRLVTFGLGGKQGKGNQMFSWIHIEDLKNCIEFIQSHPEMSGVYNCSAPNPVNNSTLMKKLRQAMGMPLGFPAPKWLLQFGAILIKTETELVLKSRWVLPEKLIKKGFVFSFPTMDDALMNLIKRK